jgi:hypothetical protein
MTAPDAYWEEAHAAFHHCAAEDARVWAEPEPEPQPALEASDLGISDDPEAGLGHDYDGPELRSGTPEYEALYAEYQAWAAEPGPEAGPVPYTLTSRAEAVLTSWDRFQALERAERLALGEAEPEPEAEL